MKRIGRHAATVAHLALYGTVGPAFIGVFFGVLGLGIGLTPVLIGFPLLALFMLLLFGSAWVHERGVAGLYGIDVPERGMRVSSRATGWRWLDTLWLQVTDGRNWKSILHGVITTVLGLVTVFLLTIFGYGIGLLFSPIFGGAFQITVFGWGIPNIDVESPWTVLVGLVFILATAGLIYGLVVAHQAISNQMLVPSREAELQAEVETASERRVNAMRAAEVERTRIERDLHDGVQPRLVSVGMTLGLAKRKIESDPEAAAKLIEEAHESTKAAVTELRQLARGINPTVLRDRGLDAALSSLVARSHIPVHLDVQLTGRCSPEAEAAMYFAVAESVTNATKHSNATHVKVTVREREGGKLWGRVEDDGQGGAKRTPDGGLDGIINRITAAGGTCSIMSPDGGPTTIEVSLPCES